MKALSLFLLFTLSLSAAVCHAEEVREIPLSEVWGYKMPGTKKLLDLDNVNNTMALPISRRLRESYFWQVRSALGGMKFLRDGAGPAFVVEGTGKEAFRNVRDVMTGDRPRDNVFPSGADLSLAFFAYESGAIYVHLSSIVVDGTTIRLTYQPVFHSTFDTTWHFALIPLGPLPDGPVRIVVIRKPTVDADGEPGYTPEGLDLRISHSASFSISSERN